MCKKKHNKPPRTILDAVSRATSLMWEAWTPPT